MEWPHSVEFTEWGLRKTFLKMETGLGRDRSRLLLKEFDIANLLYFLYLLG